MMKLIEGFDWLETADLPAAYGAFGAVTPGGTPTNTIQATGGRNGAGCLRVIPGTHGADSTLSNITGFSFPTGVADGAVVICAFAVKFNTLHDSGNMAFAGIQSTSGTGDNKYNLVLALNSSNILVPGRVSGGTTLLSYGASSTTVFSTGIWYQVAVKFQSHGSTGSVYVEINGSNEITLTGLDTLLADNGVTALVLGATIPATVTPSVDFDDVYIADTTGSYNNDFLGDVQVFTSAPNGNGNSSDFVGSDADSTDNYLLVDDAGAPDDDSTYVESSTPGDKDTYAFGNLPASAATVHAVGVKVIAKKIDVGAPDLIAVARSSTTEDDSPSLGVGTTYIARQGIFEEDPNTSAAWAPAAVDAAEFGIKVA